MDVARLIPLGPIRSSSEEMRRYLVLTLLGAWIFAGYVGGQVMSLFLNTNSYVASLPAIFIALLLGYAVYLDYLALQTQGHGWNLGMRTLIIATVVFPPYSLVYLWRRGKQIA